MNFVVEIGFLGRSRKLALRYVQSFPKLAQRYKVRNVLLLYTSLYLQ